MNEPVPSVPRDFIDAKFAGGWRFWWWRTKNRWQKIRDGFAYMIS